MLLSMTGFGEASRQNDSLAVAIEVRTINSRYFKLTVRSNEGYSSLEPQIDAQVRGHIKRGTVQVSLRVARMRPSDDFRINEAVLKGYRQQLESIRGGANSEPIRLEALLQLPGVIDENVRGLADVESDWPLVKETLEAAMANMAHMRAEEGRAMSNDLAANCAAIAVQLDEIDRRAPDVSTAYRARLAERLNKTLAEFDISLDVNALIREVSIYAERSDISEEIVRLRSHLEQFAAIMTLEDSSGRKLEFLTQEMFRETNTIGSKANDVQIARHVIEIKAAIERMREIKGDPERGIKANSEFGSGNSEQEKDSAGRIASFFTSEFPLPNSELDRSPTSQHSEAASRPLSRPCLPPPPADLSRFPVPPGQARRRWSGACFSCRPRLVHSVSATTRPPRPGEIDGEDYHFLTREEFERRRQAGDFLECFEVYGHDFWYGTLESAVTPSLAAGKWVVLEIDVQGTMAVLKRYPGTITIFVRPGSMEELLPSSSKSGGPESSENHRSGDWKLPGASWPLLDRYQHQVLNDDV